jgi:hypothetical protein
MIAVCGFHNYKPADGLEIHPTIIGKKNGISTWHFEAA